MSAWTLWDIYQGWTSNFKLVWKVRMNAKCRTACLESVRLTTSKCTPLGRAQGTNHRRLDTTGQLTVIALWHFIQKEMLDFLQEGVNLFHETFWLEVKNNPDTFNADCTGSRTVLLKTDFLAGLCDLRWWLQVSEDSCLHPRSPWCFSPWVGSLAERPGAWMVSCSWHCLPS